jgi:hypothetical protein
MQQPTTNQNGTTRGSGAGKCKAEAPADTRGGGAEAPADRRQWCDKRQHNNQPEDKRDVARGGGAMRGRGQQQLGVWACCWCRITGVRRRPLFLKWKGAQALETDPNTDIDNDV